MAIYLVRGAAVQNLSRIWRVTEEGVAEELQNIWRVTATGEIELVFVREGLSSTRSELELQAGAFLVPVAAGDAVTESEVVLTPDSGFLLPEASSDRSVPASDLTITAGAFLIPGGLLLRGADTELEIDARPFLIPGSRIDRLAFTDLKLVAPNFLVPGVRIVRDASSDLQVTAPEFLLGDVTRLKTPTNLRIELVQTAVTYGPPVLTYVPPAGSSQDYLQVAVTGITTGTAGWVFELETTVDAQPWARAPIQPNASWRAPINGNRHRVRITAAPSGTLFATGWSNTVTTPYSPPQAPGGSNG